MPLSRDERESDFARGKQSLVGRNIPRHIRRAAVGRVCIAFSTSVERVVEPAGGGEILVTLSAASMPDLASRVRRQHMATDITPTNTSSGRAGRHMVDATRLAAGHEPELRRAAAIVGCNIHVGPVTARGGEEVE